MKSIISNLILFSVLIQPLNAQLTEHFDEPMSIHSGEVEYDGSEIILKENVSISHGLGKMTANHLKISSAFEGEKKTQFSFLDMEGDVEIKFTRGGQLSCQKAFINYEKLKAIFKSNQTFPDVVFTTLSNRIPLILRCSEIEADIIREYDETEKEVQTGIGELHALGNVRANYNGIYQAIADYALYKPFSSKNSSKGILTLEVKDPDHGQCLITDFNGDQILTKKIIIDTSKEQMFCTDPKGTVALNFGNQKELLQISSDTLAWDYLQQVLTLKGQVTANLDTFFNLATPNEIRIVQQSNGPRKALKLVESPANTTLIYKDAHHVVHKIITQGSLVLDHENQKIDLSSPKDEMGRVQADKQVYLDDLFGDVYADNMTLNYTNANGHLTYTGMVMNGSVKILNRFDGHVQESGSVLQYALADHVVYNPEKREMLLSAADGNRVLFYDKVNNVQMSAPAIKVRHDEKSPKGVIQGVGDVRFTFIEHEFNQLRQRFQFKDNEK